MLALQWIDFKVGLKGGSVGEELASNAGVVLRELLAEQLFCCCRTQQGHTT